MSSASAKPKPRRKTRVDIEKAEVQESPADYTGSGASGRVLFIDTKWVKFGTDDKTLVTSFFLSAALLMLILVTIILGAFFGYEDWWKTVFEWLGYAFTFTAGVAIGKSTGN